MGVVKSNVLQNGIWAWRQGLLALVFLAMGGLYWRYEKHVDRLMRWRFNKDGSHHNSSNPHRIEDVVGVVKYRI